MLLWLASIRHMPVCGTPFRHERHILPNQPASPNLAAARRAAIADTGATTRTHLSVDGLAVSYPDRRVLTDLSFSARTGDRLGLIGENGTGKSTLLRVLAGEQAPNEGAVLLPGSVALLAQELPYPDNTPISQVFDDAQHLSLIHI